jgi:hypothetical protein
MKIRVLVDHLEHDGRRIEQGAILDLPAPHAEALVALGVAQPHAEAEAKRPKKGD